MKVEEGSGDFYNLRNIGLKTISWLKYEVPSAYRYYDNEQVCWSVHEKHLMTTLMFCYYYEEGIDYSKLSESLRNKIDQQKKSWRKGSFKKKFKLPERNTKDIVASYSTLYLTPSAPPAIVDVVWKTLARMYHPDQGGDPQQFIEIKEAYDRIKGKR